MKEDTGFCKKPERPTTLSKSLLLHYLATNLLEGSQDTLWRLFQTAVLQLPPLGVVIAFLSKNHVAQLLTVGLCSTQDLQLPFQYFSRQQMGTLAVLQEGRFL